VNEIPAGILTRKGARSTALVPADVRNLLNCGGIETKNLSEWLVVDHYRLAMIVFADRQWQSLRQELRVLQEQQPNRTALGKIQDIGRCLAARTLADDVERLQNLVQQHPSDSVRCWGCIMIGQRRSSGLAEVLPAIRPYAVDRNSSVREIAWLALRERVISDPDRAIDLLRPWTGDAEERIRRFASELTRPRGVWCRKIDRLCEDPGLGLPLLNPLRSDVSKYVRDSVGNWLNDASKTRPQFVRQICSEWQQESGTPETLYIIRRATRTLRQREESR
jgi:3-methyladenine DNA glycosylase AlkC